MPVLWTKVRPCCQHLWCGVPTIDPMFSKTPTLLVHAKKACPRASEVVVRPHSCHGGRRTSVLPLKLHNLSQSSESYTTIVARKIESSASESVLHQKFPRALQQRIFAVASIAPNEVDLRGLEIAVWPGTQVVSFMRLRIKVNSDAGTSGYAAHPLIPVVGALAAYHSYGMHAQPAMFDCVPA